MGRNEQAAILSRDCGSNLETNELTKSTKKQSQLDMKNFTSATLENQVKNEKLPEPPVRLLKGIVDICPECCRPLDLTGIRIINDSSLKIVKICCENCFAEMEVAAC